MPASTSGSAYKLALRVVGMAPPVWMLVMLVLIHPKPEIAAPAEFLDCVAAALPLVGTER